MDSLNQEVEKRASEWLSKRDRGAWSPRDQAALEQWLDESTAHTVAFIRLEAAWTRADRFKALGAGFPAGRVPTPAQISSSPFFDEPVPKEDLSREPIASLRSLQVESVQLVSPRSTRGRFPLALAASVALVIMGGVLWHSASPDSSFDTPVGGITSVPLRDGSRVTLNTDSKIRVAVTDRQRSVRLDQGEAYFEVAKDPERPFVVDAGTKRVVVLGTQFSVRRDGEQVRVVVTEGKVRVEDSTLLPARASPARLRSGSEVGGEPAGAFTLSAGGVARTGAAGVLVQSKPLAEIQEALSWRSGFVVFRDVDLSEAVTEFNRYNEKKIVIQDPGLAAIRLSGKFKATNFDAFVRLLEDGFPIDAKKGDETIVLVKRAR